MTIAFRELNGSAAGGVLQLAFGAQNPSGETAALGYQIFDAAAGIVLIDGPRFAQLAPGARKRMELGIPLPQEDGRFHVFVSTVREDVAWGYERGAPFVLAEVEVRGGAATLSRLSVTTLSRVRTARLLQAAVRAWIYPFRLIWRQRSMIRTMTRRDILARYRGSMGGLFWTLLNPLLLMATYFFVFGIVLQSRFGEDPSRAGFALYFLAGMLPWMAVSEAVGRSALLLLEHRNFIKKLVFPVETLPVTLAVSGLVTELMAFGVFLVFLFVARGELPGSALWLPAVVAPQLLMTAGLCWFIAAAGVFVRDLSQITAFALTLVFFLTPICYPEASLPREAASLLNKNPMAALVRAYRAILLDGHAPAWGAMWKLWLVSLAMFVIGHAWFYKLRRSFADVI
jgi:lipopolysaccharide transport system permease protein